MTEDSRREDPQRSQAVKQSDRPEFAACGDCRSLSRSQFPPMCAILTRRDSASSYEISGQRGFRHAEDWIEGLPLLRRG
jgi:hypothetical protein